MSQPERQGAIRSLVNRLTGKQTAWGDQLHDLGFHSIISPFFSWRTSVLLQGMSTVDDSELDIADRVDQASLLLASVGLPFARAASGGNPAFLSAFGFMRDKLADPWRGDIATRKWYREERLAKVIDYIEVAEPEPQKGGESKVVFRQTPRTRYLHEDTLAMRKALDEDLKAERPKDWKPIKFVDWVTRPMLPGAHEWFDSLGMDEEMWEQSLTIEGEEFIAEMVGFTLPLAFHDRDTPYMSGNVVFLSSQGQMEGRGGITPVAGGRPPSMGGGSAMR